MSVSEPFRSSNLQQWQIKDHKGNRLQVPVRAGFVLSQRSGKRHLLMSVNLMARQGRKTGKNCRKFFPFPSSPHPGSGWLHEGLLAASRRESSAAAHAHPGQQGGLWGHPMGCWLCQGIGDEAVAEAALHWRCALMAKVKAAVAETVRAKVSQRRKPNVHLGRCPLP